MQGKKTKIIHKDLIRRSKLNINNKIFKTLVQQNPLLNNSTQNRQQQTGNSEMQNSAKILVDSQRECRVPNNTPVWQVGITTPPIISWSRKEKKNKKTHNFPLMIPGFQLYAHQRN